MKNRMYESLPKNGKLFCLHNWEVYTEVVQNWDLVMGLKIPVRCTKCERKTKISNVRITEIPDHLVTNRWESGPWV